jgi:hypothetical protein
MRLAAEMAIKAREKRGDPQAGRLNFYPMSNSV